MLVQIVRDLCRWGSLSRFLGLGNRNNAPLSALRIPGLCPCQGFPDVFLRRDPVSLINGQSFVPADQHADRLCDAVKVEISDRTSPQVVKQKVGNRSVSASRSPSHSEIPDRSSVPAVENKLRQPTAAIRVCQYPCLPAPFDNLDQL